MSRAFALPGPYAPASDGTPLAGATLGFYKAGTTTLQGVFQDSTLQTPHINPVTANSFGVFPAIYLNPTGPDYDVVLNDINGALQYSWSAYPANEFTQAQITGLLYPQTAAEQSATITPVNYLYPPGHVYRYGTNTVPGTTDMSTAINNALASNKRVYAPRDTYFCSASLNLSSGQTFFGDGSATVLQYSNADLNPIVGTGINNTSVQDLKINVTGSGSTVNSAGVLLQSNTTYCKVLRVEVAGVNWAGVWILGSSNNSVRDCYFHNFTGTQANTSDVLVTNDAAGINLAQYNVVEGNQCFGGGWFGVAFQQFYANTITPNYNLAAHNRIGQHTAYGVLFYNVSSFTDTFNQAIGNYIENIQGSVLSNNSGMGIYVAGQGGTHIIGNTVRNCCVLTTTASLTPAGIGLNGVGGSNQSPFVISANHVENIQNFYGIEVAGWTLGGTIAGNVVSLTGGSAVYGIYVLNSSNVTVSSNMVNVSTGLASSRGIYVLANGQTISNINISGNTVNGCSLRQISCEQSGGFNVQNIVISSNSMVGGNSTCVPVQLTAVQAGTISGNMASVGTLNALNVSGCTGLRITGNYWSSGGATSVTLAGVNTNGYFDKTNYVNTALANQGTGMICEQLASATPGAGNNSAVGDRIEQSVPVVGNPKGWRCTVAGNPGTWVSEGVL